MRHLKKKKFGRGTDHRRKLLRSLASSAILYERIETSYANARAVKPYIERLITRGKVDNLHNRRHLLAKLTRNATAKVLEVYGPRFGSRQGGYMRLIKLNDPKAGNSKALLEFVE